MIKLTFSCNQDWDEMKPTACGRFCTVCKREVHDLTSKTVDEINRMKASDGQLCGMFLPEQVEQDLVPLKLSWIKKFQYASALLVTWLGLEGSTASAQAKSKPGVEVVSKDNVPASQVKSAPVIEDENGEAIETSTKTTIKQPHKSKYYLSWRFPFIHRKRHRFVGKF